MRRVDLHKLLTKKGFLSEIEIQLNNFFIIRVNGYLRVNKSHRKTEKLVIIVGIFNSLEKFNII